jgi:hypothetical protein
MKTQQRGIFEKVVGSGIWWIRFVDGSGRYRRERVGAFGLAVKLLDKRRGEAVAGKKLPETLRRKFVPFSEIAEDALVYSRAHKRSWQDDESRMKLLVEWWGSRDAESLTMGELERQLSDAARDKRWAESTFNHYRSLLMLTYREARRAEKVNVNPARDVRHRREDNSRVRYSRMPKRSACAKRFRSTIRSICKNSNCVAAPGFAWATCTGSHGRC